MDQLGLDPPDPLADDAHDRSRVIRRRHPAVSSVTYAPCVTTFGRVHGDRGLGRFKTLPTTGGALTCTYSNGVKEVPPGHVVDHITAQTDLAHAITGLEGYFEVATEKESELREVKAALLVRRLSRALPRREVETRVRRGLGARGLSSVDPSDGSAGGGDRGALRSRSQRPRPSGATPASRSEISPRSTRRSAR